MTISRTPAVTVLMSCYNAARWLSAAIASMLDQTFDDFEFVIIDDGSTDETLTLVRRFSALDDRIVVVEKKNTGLADSLNAGIRIARGKWIARLDADDISEPGRLEKQIAYAQSNPRIVFIGSGLVEIDANGKEGKTFRYPSDHAMLVRHLVGARKFPPHSSAFYTTKVVQSIGGYRPRIRRAQDFDLWLRLSETGQLSCLPDALVRVRKHGDQISHEDAGRRQVIDGRVAIASYFLRQYKCSDPVAGDDAEFERFRAWLAERLEKEKLFELEQFRTQLRTSFYRSSNAVVGSLEAGKMAIRRPFFLKLLLNDKFSGSDLPRRLALEWMGASKKASKIWSAT